MTKTVTLRDDLLELADMVVNYEAKELTNNSIPSPSLYPLYGSVTREFVLNRFKELRAAFAAAADEPQITTSYQKPTLEELRALGLAAGLNLHASTPRDDSEPPVPPTVHGEPVPAPLFLEDSDAPATPTQKKPKSRAKLPASSTSRKTPNWTLREDKILLCYKDVEPKHWSEIEARLPGRNVAACKSRLKRLMEKAGTLHTDADGTVTSARMVEPPVSGEMSTQEEIVAKVRANTSWPVARDDGIVPAEQIKEAARSVPFDATEMVQPLSHPAIKDDEPFIKQPTALEKMVGGFKRSGL